ncbi:putative S-adenosyl-L-methionine-dependent methyltransferase MidA, partial [Aphelenchoides avenae]
ESKASIHLVEISDALIDQQERLLCENPSTPVSDEAYVRKNHTRTGLPVYWYRDLDDVPAGFSVYVANEFLDALPIHQFQRDPSSGGWREVYVALKSTSDDELCFMLSKSENLHTKFVPSRQKIPCVPGFRGLIPDYVRDDNARTQWELSPKSGASVTRIMERLLLAVVWLRIFFAFSLPVLMSV